VKGNSAVVRNVMIVVHFGDIKTFGQYLCLGIIKMKYLSPFLEE